MASLLAQQDQENFVYGQQTVATAKPLNQGVKQLAPKTPGNKAAKTPFKVSRNDENALQTLGKTALKGDNGNKEFLFGGKKAGKDVTDNYATPAPRNRAPLGAKTTNAKAKPFQTPAALASDKKDLAQSKRNSLSARKPQPKISNTEPVKIDILETKDDEEPEIEYMPPRPKDMEDIPDDLDPNINMSMFANGQMFKDLADYTWHHKGFDGLTRLERENMRWQKMIKRSDAEIEAQSTYVAETDLIICHHSPECPTQECKDAPEQRRLAKETLDKKLAEINAVEKPEVSTAKPLAPKEKAKPKRVDLTKGPTSEASKSAASALSMPKPKINAPVPKPVTKPRAPNLSSLLPRNKKPEPPKPTNPSSMRHAAAVAASNTTLGYGKGRAASTQLRRGALAPKDTNSKTKPPIPVNSSTKPSIVEKAQELDLNALEPEEFMRQYGEPKFLSEMWWRCRNTGLIKMPGDEEREAQKRKEDEEVQEALFGGMGLEEWETEEAEREFVLELP